LFGGPTRDIRAALAVTTSLRNFGVGLAISTSAFAGTPAVPAIVAYGLVSLVGTLAFSMLTGKRTSRGDGASSLIPPGRRPIGGD
jgi:BASS family bile acid:Na+ symporter